MKAEADRVNAWKRKKVWICLVFPAALMAACYAVFFGLIRWKATIPPPVWLPSVVDHQMPAVSQGSRGYIHIYDWNFQESPDSLMAMCRKAADLKEFHFQSFRNGTQSSWSTDRVQMKLPGFKAVMLAVDPGQISGPNSWRIDRSAGSHLELFELNQTE